MDPAFKNEPPIVVDEFEIVQLEGAERVVLGGHRLGLVNRRGLASRGDSFSYYG